MANKDDAPSAALPGAAAIGLAGALSLAVAMGIGRFAFTPQLPLMIQGGQLDVAGGGWLAAANYAGYLAGALTASRLPLRPARLAVAALMLTVVLTAAMALPLPVPAWAALRLAAGVASAWAFVATSVWCLNALARHGSTGWASALYAGVGSGIALAGLYCLAGGVLQVGAAALWWQLGLLALVLTVPVLAVLRRLPAAPAAAPIAGPTAGGTAPVRTGGLVLSYGLFGFGYILPATFLPVLARGVVDDPRLFGLAWPVFGLTAAVSAPLAGWWLRRASRLQVWAVSQALMGLGVLLPSLWLAGWSIALSALLVGGTFMVATLAGVQEIRVRAGADAARAVARMTTAFALGQIAGPVVSNLLLRWSGPGAAGSLDLALQLGAAGLLGSAFWLWRAHAPPLTKEMTHVH
ncbi:YbfB/YjiJ family MFS transporter [Ramlibacter tataouinensis]|uniref:Candidate transporter n=1 Tax=Ramlibacter tataouinensis (strain ATCC BAA-407 / DSM 14655 / LMG 21543 / TTB310) TaxID=365046 RepID=F5Y3X7_RAMTT|nr:YbfB/YjiJ family MFS transporter [Ramlibacter tataouinensis]AEG91255.1 Candidate transporter [Ramlibacter tataouinensis TTB310]